MPDNIIGNLGQGTWEHRDDGNGNIIQVWVPAVPPEPVELLNNGTFDSDINNWTFFGTTTPPFGDVMWGNGSSCLPPWSGHSGVAFFWLVTPPS